MHYSLRDSILKIIIKDSFTEDFYPSQAFSSDEMEKFCYGIFLFLKKLIMKLCRMVFGLMKMLYIGRVVQL